MAWIFFRNRRRFPRAEIALRREIMNLTVKSFWMGVRAEFPLLIGVFPFGLIYGALALASGLSPAAAQMMSSIVFAGSSQFVAVQLIREAAPWLVIVLTIAVVNLRHMLYSASIAPYIEHLPARWKTLLAYLLTDEAYAVTIVHFEKEEFTPAGHWFFFGAGLALWTTWQISSALGIFLGTALPASWPLDFAVPITFIAMVMPMLKERPLVAAAASAGTVALLAYSLPFKLGLILAALVGILVGTYLENRK
jgi:4-azaleucine resistance transporter AzlC